MTFIGFPFSPLFPIDRPKVSILVRPFIPDSYVILFRYSMLVSPLMNHRSSCMTEGQCILRRHCRETIVQGEPHLMSKDRKGSGPSSISFSIPSFRILLSKSR